MLIACGNKWSELLLLKRMQIIEELSNILLKHEDVFEDLIYCTELCIFLF